MDITKLNFGEYTSSRITSSFEDLDVNSDGKINEDDKKETTNTSILNQIAIFLSDIDEENEEELELIDDFDFSSDVQKAASSNDCPNGDCSVSASSPLDCPNGNCTAIEESSNNNRVNHPDGSYTETTTNANGQTIEKTYDSSGKRISQKVTNKDGSTVNYTFEYNDNGSYTQTAVYKDKTRVTKYNSAGKRISYTETYKDGTVKTATFKYNDNGSYSIIIKNKKTGTVTTKKYNTRGKITSSVSKSKKNMLGKRRTTKKIYDYNSDGSYKVTSSDSGWVGKGSVKVANYDANGNKVKAGASTNTITSSDSNNYKDKLNQNGVTFVIFTGTGCGHCSMLKNNLNSVLSATDGLANFTEINIRDAAGNNIESNCNFMWSLAKKYNAIKDNSIGLPLVVKFVNGKPAGVVKFSETNSATLFDQIRSQCKNATAKASTTSTTSTAIGTPTSEKKKTAPTTVTSKNYKNNIAKKGVTYLIMGDTKGCGGCIRLDNQLKKLMKNGKLQDSTILSMNISDSASGKILEDYLTQFNMWQTRKDGSKYANYPLILKFVDGKAVGFVSNISDISDADLIKKLS